MSTWFKQKKTVVSHAWISFRSKHLVTSPLLVAGKQSFQHFKITVLEYQKISVPLSHTFLSVHGWKQDFSQELHTSTFFVLINTERIEPLADCRSGTMGGLLASLLYPLFLSILLSLFISSIFLFSQFLSPPLPLSLLGVSLHAFSLCLSLFVHKHTNILYVSMYLSIFLS